MKSRCTRRMLYALIIGLFISVLALLGMAAASLLYSPGSGARDDAARTPRQGRDTADNCGL